MRVINLRADRQTEPMGVETKKPVLSWQPDFAQKAYEICVTDDEGREVWKTGKVTSGDTNAIFGGRLEGLKKYIWKVTCYGESETAYAQSFFETAFIGLKFNASWIGQPLGFSGSVDDIRVDLDVFRKVRRARFYVAMLGTGKVYLNGKLLDDCYFDGGVTPYSKVVYYRTYALDLKEGRNALCMRVGYGFYGAKKVCGIVRIEYEDGTVEVLPTMPGRIWSVKRDAVRINGVYDGEVYDARLEENWLDPVYKMTYGNWVATFAVDPPAGELKSNPIPPMRIVEKFAPKSVKAVDNALLVDAGINVCGFLSVKMRGNCGDKITVYHAERLLENGQLDNANYRAAEAKDVYILSGKGEEEYTPGFTYHGFRYALIKTEGSVEITDVQIDYLRTDVALTGEFVCSDQMLNTLHKMAVQTEGNNLNGVFTDCPQRDERLGWLNDLSSRIFQSVNNYGLEKFLPNYLDMITVSQTEEGVISDTVPYTVGCDVADPISAYMLLGKLALDYYGDIEAVSRNYEGFAKWISYLKSNADENGGTVSYGYYGDWCPADPYADGTHSRMVSIAFVSGIYFLWYLKMMSSFAKLLNKEEDAVLYSSYYEKYKQNFKQKYFDSEKRIYGNGSQTELAVCVTVFDEEQDLCEYWMKLADADVKQRGYHTTSGNQGYRHLIYNLAEYGYSDTVVKLLQNREYPGWGFMVECGATTVWERWENKIGDDMHSFNHPMFSAYDGFFYNYLLGIRPDLSEDGFKRVVIKPCFPEALGYCNGSLKTVRGKISVGWKRENGKIAVDVDVPLNTQLEFINKDFKIKGKNYKGSAVLAGGHYVVEIM